MGGSAGGGDAASAPILGAACARDLFARSAGGYNSGIRG